MSVRFGASRYNPSLCQVEAYAELHQKHAVPVGLIFGYWFAKTGKLWPPIVAHAAINLLSLLAM